MSCRDEKFAEPQGPGTGPFLIFDSHIDILADKSCFTYSSFAGEACAYFESELSPRHRYIKWGERWSVGEIEIYSNKLHESDLKSGGGNFPHKVPFHPSRCDFE